MASLYAATIAIVIFHRTPFQVFNDIVIYVFIFVVYLRQFVWIIYKTRSHQSTHSIIPILSVLVKTYNIVPFTIPGFDNPPFGVYSSPI